MTRTQKLVRLFYRTRSSYYRWSRLLFPSAAEVRFIEIMGGRFYTINWLRHYKTKRPFVIMLSLGRVLNDEKFRREVRTGRYWADFANDVGWTIEVDSVAWHKDIVAEFDRESYLYQRGYRTLHIEAGSLWRDPSKVQRRVLHFIYAK